MIITYFDILYRYLTIEKFQHFDKNKALIPN